MNQALAAPCSIRDVVVTQTGSVVSRVLFRNPGGTLTAFAFAEGEGLDEHTNPADAFVHILEGQCTVAIEDVEHDVVAGEMLHLPASVPHAIRPGSSFRMLLTLLKTSAPGQEEAAHD